MEQSNKKMNNVLKLQIFTQWNITEKLFFNESQRHAEQKNLDTEEYVLYNLNHMKSYDEPELLMAIQIQINLCPTEGSDAESIAKEYNKAFLDEEDEI